MTISEIIAEREPEWKELEDALCVFSKKFRAPKPEEIARFSYLYRSVCSDLALAESYRLPNGVVRRLNDLVARAHNALYKRRRFTFSDFFQTLLYDLPRWVVGDPAFWVAFALFWFPFFFCMLKSSYDPDFAREIVGIDALRQIESMYVTFLDADALDRVPAVMGYIHNNGGIGLKCFCMGCLGCLPGLYILLYNSVFLGSVFGYMRSPEVDAVAWSNFSEFTTAHGPFELTAIVLSAAAGLRCGFGLVYTQGYSRLDSFRRASIQASPTMFVAFILFCMAAFIEGLISPSRLEGLQAFLGLDSYAIKKAIQLSTGFLLFVYFFVLGGFPFLKKRFFRGER